MTELTEINICDGVPVAAVVLSPADVAEQWAQLSKIKAAEASESADKAKQSEIASAAAAESIGDSVARAETAATNAKKSETLAQESSDEAVEAKDYVETARQEVGNTVNLFMGTLYPQALTGLSDATDVAKESINSHVTGTSIPSIDSHIKTATDKAISDVNNASAENIVNAGDAALTQIGLAKTVALGDITTLAGTSTTEITTLTATSKGDITTFTEAAKTYATTEIDKAATVSKDEAITAIDSKMDYSLASLESTTNSGIATIFDEATKGAADIQAATTLGTGTINTAVSTGKTAIDSYVASTNADLARRSQANIWGGVNTFNSTVAINSNATCSAQHILGETPLNISNKMASICQSIYATAAYGAVSCIITGTKKHKDDLIQSAVNATSTTAVAPISTFEAWMTAYSYMTPPVDGDYCWVRPEGSFNYTWRQSHVYCARIASGYPYLSIINLSEIGHPIAVGVWAASGDGDKSIEAPKNILRRPWDVSYNIYPASRNAGQPIAIECHAAYGHDVPSILTSGGVSPGSTVDARPAMRYMSPITEVASVSEIWFMAGGDAIGRMDAISSIITRDGKNIQLRHGSHNANTSVISAIAKTKTGKKAAITCAGVSAYPNLLNLSGTNSEGSTRHPFINPVQFALKETCTHNFVAHETNASISPPCPGKAVSLTYVEEAPEKEPNRIDAGTNLYGKQLTIAATAQDITMTLPANVVADVDTWSREWCVLDESMLRITANDTGKPRYVSIWFYTPNLMPSLIWEIGITQLA